MYKLVSPKELFKLRLISEVKLQEMIDNAISAAVIEERKWKSLESSKGGVEITFWDDPFYATREAISSKEFEARRVIEEEAKIPISVIEASGLSASEAKDCIIREAKLWRESFKGYGVVQEGMKNIKEDFHVTRQLSISELFYMQDAAFHKRYRDPHAASIVENITNYVIGRGIVVKAADPKVGEGIRQFRVDNRMQTRERSIVENCYLEGEYFNIFYDDTKNGRSKVRRILNREVYEVETHPDDYETPLAYHRLRNFLFYTGLTSTGLGKEAWYPDINYYEQLSDSLNGERSSKHDEFPEDTVVQHIKYGSSVRGRLPMEPSLRYMKCHEDWVDDRIRLNHERAKVLFVKEIKGRSSETTARYQRPPQGGITLIETENVKWRIMSADIAAGDAKEDGLSILYMIGAGVCVPIHILDQRADQEVYASIKKAETPFSNMIIAQQEFYKNYFTDMYQHATWVAVQAGKLPKKTKVRRFTLEAQDRAYEVFMSAIVGNKGYRRALEAATDSLSDPEEMKEVDLDTIQVPLNFTFPDIVREDPLTLAREIFLLDKTGIFSRTFLAALRGRDYIEEQWMRRHEPTPVLSVPSGNGFPGGSQSDGSGEPSDDPGSQDVPFTQKGTKPGEDDQVAV